jgi:hypothetical protein
VVAGEAEVDANHTIRMCPLGTIRMVQLRPPVPVRLGRTRDPSQPHARRLGSRQGILSAPADHTALLLGQGGVDVEQEGIGVEPNSVTMKGTRCFIKTDLLTSRGRDQRAAVLQLGILKRDTKIPSFETATSVPASIASSAYGAHGRPTENENAPLLISNAPALLPERPIAATAVKDLVLAHVFERRSSARSN